MSHFQRWIAVLVTVAATGCATAPARGPTGGSRNAGPEIWRVPERVGELRRVDVHRYPQRALGTAYRYTDGSSLRLDLFVYPLSPTARSAGDVPRRQAQAEAQLLRGSLPEGRNRGWFTSYEIVADSLVIVELPAGSLEGSHMAVRIDSAGVRSESHQHLFVLDNEFAKVRTDFEEGSVPLARLESWITDMLRQMTTPPEPANAGS